MFDIGFSELLLIAVVALVVLGPERLPKAARFVGLWVRKARAQWYSVKSEFEREMAADEFKRSVGDPLKDLQRDFSAAGDPLKDIKRELADTGDDVGKSLREAKELARADGDAATAVLDIPAPPAPETATDDAPGDDPATAPPRRDAER